jgi:hypothetical protein
MQLALPKFESFSEQQLQEYAALQLPVMNEEAKQAAEIARTAYQRGWSIGKACVQLKESIGSEKWEDFATEHIGIGNYWQVFRCMRMARLDLHAPNLKNTSALFKQTLIAIGDEAAPKPTPRKTDVHKFQNLKASLGCIRRWWREGEALQSLDQEMIEEIVDDMKFIIAIYDKLQQQISEPSETT